MFQFVALMFFCLVHIIIVKRWRTTQSSTHIVHNQYDDPLPFKIISNIIYTGFKNIGHYTYISTCHALLILLTAPMYKNNKHMPYFVAIVVSY